MKKKIEISKKSNDNICGFGHIAEDLKKGKSRISEDIINNLPLFSDPYFRTRFLKKSIGIKIEIEQKINLTIKISSKIVCKTDKNIK